MSKADLRVDWATHEAAKYACENWHYSRSIPVGKLVKVGVWESNKFIGCVIFSCGSAGVGLIGPSLGVPSELVAELARVALTKHETPVTRIISICFIFIGRQCPGLRLIVSYADPMEGHIGGIYQGGNWIYTGRSAKDFAYIDTSGKRWHSRSVSDKGFKTRLGKKTSAPSPVGMKRIELTPKYKYVFPLDNEMRARVLPLSKPYPKRPKQAMAPDQGEQRRGGTDPDAPIPEGQS